MRLRLSLVLIAFTAFSLATLLMVNLPVPSSAKVLGTTSVPLKVLDDGNGTLYIEYGNAQEAYNALSGWQGKYPGRTVYAATSLSTGSSKVSALIITYIGR